MPTGKHYLICQEIIPAREARNENDRHLTLLDYSRGVIAKLLLRQGERRYIGMRRPSLRTGLADFPHPALQLVVLPRRGLAEFPMGVLKTEKDWFFSKEFIRPAKMIHIAAFAPCTLAALSQNTAQTTSYPAIKRRKCPLMAMLEILKPSP
jgi:hypothetical protein